MRRRALALTLLMGLAACDDMREQPVRRGDQAAPELPGGMGAQIPIPGTLAVDQLTPEEAATPPAGWTRAELERGRERFGIFCTPCHGLAGDGDGIVVARGFPSPPSLHAARLRQAPDGHLYQVVTNGLGDMYPFAAQLDPGERWAVVGYVRALQLARHAPADALPADLREALEAAEPGSSP